MCPHFWRCRAVTAAVSAALRLLLLLLSAVGCDDDGGGEMVGTGTITVIVFIS